ncbi:MAG: RNA pseudouridine synthase [Rhodothermaceae bacterium]|nr:RNA pseudouridine synthase [Rhodothermaceae bacterium]MYF63980.1 RNA pseudouridine synthase [Rhodothermaceae bacterium]MYI85049.1 RNA pseudouridine synthase [Rhodothermaceae bacterium]
MWLFEDNHLLTLNKPAGLLSQADITGDPDLVTLARGYLKKKYNKPGNVYIGLVHRLDRPASGAMVLARTSKAARRLSQAFRDRQIRKEYIVVVEGLIEGSGVMEDYLRKEAGRTRVVQDERSGKYASLRWRALNSDGNFSSVRVELITGRAHQVRCQFAARGFPVLGDVRYGARYRFDGRNIALHCSCLTFDHPVVRVPVEVNAAFPESWSAKLLNLIETD